ncbi:MAG: DUF4129 domain-containing protein [Anaerolinea sp.]|nr:DUF4129 domain-containing protein [Anaerolinea sp.]
MNAPTTNQHPSFSVEGQEFVTNVWSRHLTQPLAIASLVTALSLGFTSIIDRVYPVLPWWSLGPVFFLTALEAVYTTIWLHHPDRRIVARLWYRTAEFFTLMLLLRLGAWFITKQPAPDLELVRLYLRAPLLIFADWFFIVMVFLTILNWLAAIRVSVLFTCLAITPAEAAFYVQPVSVQKQYADDKPIHMNRALLVQEFFRLWLWGGIVLIVCVGLSAIELSDLVQQFTWRALTHLELRSELLTALILYFLAGFWLLSQGRLEMFNARWLRNGARKQAAIERQWQRSSLLLLLGIALVTAFLPIGSTLPISRLLAMVMNILYYIMTLIFYLFSLTMGLLLSLLASRLPNNETEPIIATPPPPEELIARQQEIQPAPPNPAMTLVMSSLFWTILIVVTVAAVLFYLRDRGYRVNGRLLRQFWDDFMQWINNFWEGISAQVVELRHTLQQRWQKETSPTNLARPSLRFMRLSALSPRDQIRYFYLVMARRAAEQGCPRHHSATPLEYGRELQEQWPPEQQAIAQLTHAFLEARYSAQPIDSSQVRVVKDTWKRIRGAIRKRETAADQ